MNDPAENTPDDAMTGLTELFSKLHNAAHLRCCTDGPNEMDFCFETALDEVFGANPNSEYKCFVRRLYRLGLVPKMPSEWQT